MLTLICHEPVQICLTSSESLYFTCVSSCCLCINHFRKLSFPFLPGGLSGRGDATAIQASTSADISDWVVVANEDITTSVAASCQSEQTAD